MAEDHIPTVFLNVNSNGNGMLVVDGVDLSSIVQIKTVHGNQASPNPPQIELVMWVANGWISLDGKRIYDCSALDPNDPEPPTG